MRRDGSLGPEYFEQLYATDPDPWKFETSAYEAAKYAHTIESVSGRHYAKGFEIGCANGVLTRRLGAICDRLLAIDVSETALARARSRCADLARIRFERMIFPKSAPAETGFDLAVLSEVVYYWDDADLVAAAAWLRLGVVSDGLIVLVHWTGDTDYPKSADDAVASLRHHCGDAIAVALEVRRPQYRLDLWRRC